MGNTTDTGRERITLNPTDRYTFKVPSLRNVEETSPYMHDGRFETLEEVLDYYAHHVVESPTLDSLLSKNGTLGIEMNDQEQQQIISFLRTLTDASFIRNEMLSEF